MVYFPKSNTHDWVLLSSLYTDTDEVMSLKPMKERNVEGEVSDPLQAALENLFGGGR
jgi:hypothetical protein